MSNKLDYKEAFVILAETLNGWKSPVSEEGKKIVQMHYQWANDLLRSGHMLMAGPLDRELFTKSDYELSGHITGLIIIKASSKEEAELLAYQDPFHVNGYRKNRVYTFAIGFANPEILSAIS